MEQRIGVARLLLEVQRFQYENTGEYNSDLAYLQTLELLEKAECILNEIEIDEQRRLVEALSDVRNLR